MNTKKHLSRRLMTTMIACLAASACATQPRREEPAPAAAPQSALSDSTVDISYVLGHNHRRFLAKAKDNACLAQTYLDRQILKESEIDGKHYEQFLAKVTQFIRTPHRNPADCRYPYTVTVRVGERTEAFRGCRSTDDGTLSHLVRDGEFLLYSKK